MTGVNRKTGQVINGWDEVRQSLGVLVTTSLGSRVMRRALGRRDSHLLDRPTNENSLVDFNVSVVEAVRPRVINGHQYGEPRFSLTHVLPSGDNDGNIKIEIRGIYFPNGHLGDFTAAQPQSFVISDFVDVAE